MKLNLQVTGTPPKREDHLKGVLVSLLDVADQILERRRKTSYLLHFFEERLTKTEQREFSTFLKRLVAEIHRTIGPKTESQSLGESHETLGWLKRFQSFGDFSKSAKISHQAPKADAKPPAEDGSNTLAREVLELSKERKPNEA